MEDSRGRGGNIKHISAGILQESLVGWPGTSFPFFHFHCEYGEVGVGLGQRGWCVTLCVCGLGGGEGCITHLPFNVMENMFNIPSRQLLEYSLSSNLLNPIHN
jgi:hypothetical protein